MGHGCWVDSFGMLDYTSIFSVQSAVHLSICVLIGLLVCWSVSHAWRLSACLTIHVSLCVYLYVYLFVSLFVFWSVYISLHQFVCLVSISICLCPFIHLEFLSTTALLSPITYLTNG